MNLAFALIITFALADDDIEFWNKEFDKSILNVTVESYDKFVVDPNTQDIYPGKPWVIFFYWKQCIYCKFFMPYFEKAAIEN